MKYEDALKNWGMSRLECSRCKAKNGRATLDSVEVLFVFDEGYACCGGSDPNCYCSMAESPKAEVDIRGTCCFCSGFLWETISAYDFDFSTVLREIVVAAGGTVNL